MVYDIVIVHALSQKTLDKQENIKLDEALKCFGAALLAVTRSGLEIEVGIRRHEPV